jgi:hypothetical protein
MDENKMSNETNKMRQKTTLWYPGVGGSVSAGRAVGIVIRQRKKRACELFGLALVVVGIVGIFFCVLRVISMPSQWLSGLGLSFISSIILIIVGFLIKRFSSKLKDDGT